MDNPYLQLSSIVAIVPTTITVDPSIRDRLKTYGLAGQTYNDILQTLMDQVDREKYVAMLRRRARGVKDWVDHTKLDWS